MEGSEPGGRVGLAQELSHPSRPSGGGMAKTSQGTAPSCFVLRDHVGCTLSAPPSREHGAGLYILESLSRDILDLPWECVGHVPQVKTPGDPCSVSLHLFSDYSLPPLCQVPGTEEKQQREEILPLVEGGWPLGEIRPITRRW